VTECDFVEVNQRQTGGKTGARNFSWGHCPLLLDGTKEMAAHEVAAAANFAEKKARRCRPARAKS
jgi:hypothetical protein